MRDATRRGFLAGTLAGAAAVPALARAEIAGAASPRAEQTPVRRGRAIAVAPHGDRVVVAHDQRRTIAILRRGRSRILDVGGQPLELAVSPDGRLAAVTTASWDKPGLAIVDLRAGTLRTRVDVGPAPFGVAFSSDGRRMLVSGGEQEGTVHVVDARRLVVLASAPVGLVPRGVAVVPGKRQAWVALNADDQVVRVDLRSGRVGRSIPTPPLPERVAVSPDGRRLLISHGGRAAERVTEIDLRTGRGKRRRAGRQPSGVAWTPRGRAVVALGGSGEIVVLTARRRRRKVGGSPRGVAVAGSRAWTVDALTGSVDRVRT